MMTIERIESAMDELKSQFEMITSIRSRIVSFRELEGISYVLHNTMEAILSTCAVNTNILTAILDEMRTNNLSIGMQFDLSNEEEGE